MFATGGTDGSIVFWVKVFDNAGATECVITGEECGGSKCGLADGTGQCFAPVVKFGFDGEACFNVIIVVIVVFIVTTVVSVSIDVHEVVTAVVILVSSCSCSKFIF